MVATGGLVACVQEFFGLRFFMHLRTLGGLVFEGCALRRSKLLLLLAYLALEGPTTRRELADLFWQDALDPRDSVSTAIRRIKADAPGALAVEFDRVETLVGCDALDLRQASRVGNSEALLDQYGGPFLQGLELPLSSEIEEWVYATREHLAYCALQAHIRLAEKAVGGRALTEAQKHAEAILDMREAPPLERHDLQRVFRVLRATGSARAREARALAEEIGLNLEGLDIAAHRENAGAADDGPGAGRGVPSTLTSVGTPFVGRSAELGHLSRALEDPYVRLLTLHGPGGVGKSRLAVQAAQDALDAGTFEDGVHLIAMDSLTDAKQVPFAVADAMMLQLLPHVSAVQQLVAHVGSKRMLVILDNAEHLLPMTDLVNALLAGCQNLMLIATSRVRLNAQRETVLPVSGLPVRASSEDVSDAVKLFDVRAKRAKLDFELSSDVVPAVERVCELVEGFPLGIELAANWVHALSPEQIAQEIAQSMEFLSSHLHDAPARHQSLRGVVSHSWGLLSADAQAAFRRLAVFRGGFTHEAARVVTQVQMTVLRELLDASLIRATQSERFERHPLVYEFAVEKLQEVPGEAQAYRDAHATFFLDLLADMTDGIIGGPGLPAAAQTIDVDLPNIREAWAWAAERGMHDMLPIGSLALVFYAEVRGRYAEVGEINQYVIEHLSAENDPEVCAWASAVACKAYTQFRMGQLDAAGTASLAALECIKQSSGRDADIAMFIAAVAAANVGIGRGEYGVAAERIDWALRAAHGELSRAESTVDLKRAEVMAGGAHEIRGMVATLSGDYQIALEHLFEGERLLRKHHSPILCNVLWHLGQVHTAQGDHERARAILEDGYDLAKQMQYRTMEAYIGGDLAKAMFESGNLERVEELSREVLALARSLHVRELEVAAFTQMGRCFGARSKHLDALAQYESALRSAVASQWTFAAMEALVGASDSLAALGHVDSAAEVLTFVVEHSGTPDVNRAQASEELRRLTAAQEQTDEATRGLNFGVLADLQRYLAAVVAGQST